LVIAVLGVWKAGGTYVPIDPQLTADHVKMVLESTQADVVLTQQHLMYALPRTGAKVICVDADWARIAEASGENVASGVTPQQVAYVMYTVDFSEQAGGMKVDHRRASKLLSVQKEASHITADSRVLQFASISSELSLFEMFATLTSGATLVLASTDTLHTEAKLATLLREQKLSFALLTPDLLASLHPVELPVLQVVGAVGEVRANALAETWAAGRTFLTLHGQAGVTFSEYVAPRDELETQLQRLMEELLSVRPIGVRDNFFDLGGHSFLGVSLLARIRDEFGIELPLPSLFEAGTIERMAQYMQNVAQEALAKVVPVEA
jgi:non-ribosomal peptide synthetase component F